MLIGAACSVQQRVLTRLPGTRFLAFFFPLERILSSRCFRLDSGRPLSKNLLELEMQGR